MQSHQAGPSEVFNLSHFAFAHLHTFMLCNVNIGTQDHLTYIALLVYGVYTTTNQLRPNPPSTHSHTYDMVVQHIREGAKHHHKATQAIDNIWNPYRQLKPIPPIGIHI